jgi:glutamine phosphoribosylpyrophosphate amidotransferase
MKESSIRGLHAFGFTYMDWDTGELHTIKTLKLATVLGHMAHILEEYRIEKLIAHNRYSTSGDWQTLENNQPIDLGWCSLCFNGVISMATKEEFEEEFGFECVTYNDGEIFMRHVQQGGDPAEFVASIRGSFAGCFMMDGEVYALRNARRPLYYVAYEDTTFVGSTRDILLHTFDGAQPVEMPENVCYTLKQLREERPVAMVSQQDSRLLDNPQHYMEHDRYGPRARNWARTF